MTTSQQLKAFGFVVSPDAAGESLVLQQQILALYRVFRHTTSANVSNVLSNLELLAFGNVWFGRNRWGAAQDISDVESIMTM
jgi:hypothetical protein